MTRDFQDDYGVEVIHAWGMTEMSPLGTLCTMKPEYARLTGEAQLHYRDEAGPPAVRRGDEDHRRRRQSTAPGRQDIRPAEGSRAGGRRRATTRSKTRRSSTTDGFFDTGDVATMDRYGYMQITDRAKDVIKSGGEWISSIDLENLAVGHPKAAEAAVIGVTHPKWDERPLLVIELKKGESATREEFLGYMEGKIAKWWMPDDVVFVDEIPHTATGKI